MSDRWERIATSYGGTVGGFAAARSEAANLLFAATSVGVFRSSDGGQAWSLPGSAPTVAFASSVVASSRCARDRTLFACGPDGLHRSIDGGGTWDRVLVGSRMLSVAVSVNQANDAVTVIAATETDGILRSEDGGRSWTGANAGLLDLTALCLALSPCFESDHVAFAGTASGLYRTRNAARSWRAIDIASLEEPAVQCLAVSPAFADDGVVLAGTEVDGLLRSTDAGTSWTRPPSLAEGGVAALAFNPSDSRTILAATDAGVALSCDAGETWQILESAPSEPALGLLFDGANLLVGLHRAGIVKSSDNGATWRPAIDGLSARLDTELVLSAEFARDRTLFVAGLENGVRASTDGGPTWQQQSDGLRDLAVHSLATSGSSVYVANGSGVHVRGAAGLTWQAAFVDGGPARIVAAGPGGTVVAALDGGRLVASSDDGGTWRELTSPAGGAEVAALAIGPDGTLASATVSATDVTIWRSTDRGQHWQRWLVQPGVAASRVALALTPTHAVDRSMFVGLGGSVLRPLRHAEEVRGGERRPVWRGARLGSQALAITSLAVSPNFAEDHTVFVATNAGVFISRDGGEVFEAWNDGLDNPRVVSIAISPAGELVYALGLGGTVWKRTVTRQAARAR